MSIKIGNVDILNQTLDNEFKIRVLEIIVDNILLKNPNILSKGQLKEIRLNVLKSLQKKYPEAGIELKEVDND
jgi:hypothetical protein